VSANPQTLTGGEAVALTLRGLGVDRVFGIVSVHNIPIYDAILRLGGIEPVSVRHEQGAAHAADGYARATGRLGVAITSTGPGAANAMSGLYEAAFGSSPVMMITGQIESRFYGKGKGFLHEAERQLDMLRSVTRRAESVRRTEDIPETIVRLARDAMTGRPQPVAVEIPIDLQYASREVLVPEPAGAFPPVRPDTAAVEAAAAALSAAERPLIWAGGGVCSANASRALGALAEALGSPVLTTVSGRGAIPEDHRLALGALTGNPAMRETIGEADVVLAVGTRFQAGDTGSWNVPIPGRLIHLDADPGVIGRSYRAELPIVGDARLGLEALIEVCKPKGADAAFVEKALAARDTAVAGSRQMIGADHAAVMDIIRESLPRDGVIVRDSTIPAYLWADRLLPIYEPRTSIRPSSSAIGPGLPLAVGASIGSGKPTVLICGDGGVMLTIGELATASQYNVPLVVCVFNDGGYGVLRAIQSRTFEGRQTGVDLVTPDFAALAASMSLAGEPVKGVDGFRDGFKRALDSGGPCVLDIDMDSLAPLGAFGRPRPQS
jgi:acetolactate synthase-1/2/3 large subunit